MLKSYKQQKRYFTNSPSNTTNNLKPQILGAYRQILKLQKTALGNENDYSIKEATSMARNEFKKNKNETDFNHIEAHLYQAHQYIARLRAQTLDSQSNVRYNTREYWEQYYTPENEEGMMDEWYCDYSTLMDMFSVSQRKSLFHNQSQILNLGSGISSIGPQLLGDGRAKTVHQIDFSSTAVDFINGIYEGLDSLKTVRGDFRSLHEHYREASMDVVLDKGGIDSLLGGEQLEDVEQVEREVWRVLRPNNGVFIVVTATDEATIGDTFDICPWEMKYCGALPNFDQIHVHLLYKTLREK